MNDYTNSTRPSFDPCGPDHAEAGVAVNIPLATLRDRFATPVGTIADKVKPKNGGGS